jgi:protease II
MSKCCDGIAIFGCSLSKMLAKIRDLVKSGADRLNCWGSRSTILDTTDDSQISQVSDQNTQVERGDVEVIESNTPVKTQPELTPYEQKRMKNREYERKYRLRRKQAKEAAKARQIILDFKKRKETSTADELSDWFLSVGTYVANTLLEMIGQEQFDQFTAQYKGVSRLELIPEMIELLVECIVSQ